MPTWGKTAVDHGTAAAGISANHVFRPVSRGHQVSGERMTEKTVYYVLRRYVTNGQIFGLKNSHATRAAERFFKGHRATIQFVNLNERSIAAAEMRRFIDRFGLQELVDRESKSWIEAGLGYFKLSDGELPAKIDRDPNLRRLPFVRAGNRLTIGRDEAGWKEILVQSV
jgi:arsenate reductase